MGIKDKLGIKQKPKPTEMQREREAREEKEIAAWRYVRQSFDHAVQKYLNSGSTTDLENLLDPTFYQEVIASLQPLVAANMQWSFPERYQVDNTKYSGRVTIEIASEETTSDGKIRLFTIREYFDDHSRQGQLSDNRVVGKALGDRKGTLAKVEYLGEARYRLIDCHQIPGV